VPTQIYYGELQWHIETPSINCQENVAMLSGVTGLKVAFLPFENNGRALTG